MIRRRFIRYTTKTRLYKGDIFYRSYLVFSITYFGLFKRFKEITYDVTMFENISDFQAHWEKAIRENQQVERGVIKDRIIF